MYVMLCTRPDICYAVGIVSRFQSNPGFDHWVVVKHILKYLRRTRNCDAPKPGGPLTTRQPAEYKWRSGYPTPLLENRAESPLYGELYPETVPVYTCPKQSNICNIYPIWPLGPINSTQYTYQL